VTSVKRPPLSAHPYRILFHTTEFCQPLCSKISTSNAITQECSSHHSTSITLIPPHIFPHLFPSLLSSLFSREEVSCEELAEMLLDSTVISLSLFLLGYTTLLLLMIPFPPPNPIYHMDCHLPFSSLSLSPSTFSPYLWPSFFSF